MHTVYKPSPRFLSRVERTMEYNIWDACRADGAFNEEATACFDICIEMERLALAVNDGPSAWALYDYVRRLYGTGRDCEILLAEYPDIYTFNV